MPYLARKISRGKWDAHDDLAPEEIPADAVTSDLRTSGNALSFWRLDTPESSVDIGEVVLALAAGADRIDKMDLIWINAGTIGRLGIAMRDCDGRTPVVSLRQNHVDATRLDANRLYQVAGLINDGLVQKQFQRFTKKEVVLILANAVREKFVSLDELDQKMHEEIRKQL